MNKEIPWIYILLIGFLILYYNNKIDYLEKKISEAYSYADSAYALAAKNASSIGNI
jgi:hypothetical protein